MARRLVVRMVLLLPLLLAPAAFADTPPVPAETPPASGIAGSAGSAGSAAEVPGTVPEVQWLSGFLCQCFHQDPCSGGAVYDETTCQYGQRCGCYFDFTDYVDGYTCYHGAHAYCY